MSSPPICLALGLSVAAGKTLGTGRYPHMDLSTPARAVWGKTAAASARPQPADTWHPLIAHANVAGQLWERFLSPGLKGRIAAHTGGEDHAACLLAWLAGLHDLGKGGDFQAKSPLHAKAGRAAGLPYSEKTSTPHALVSAHVLYRLLDQAFWDDPSWAALILGGHHGEFPPPNWREIAHRELTYEAPAWQRIRTELYEAITAYTGAAPAAWRTTHLPLPLQLTLTGTVILADWLASTESLFPYENGLPDNYPALSAARSTRVRQIMGVTDVWRPDPALTTGSTTDLFAARWPAITQPNDVQTQAHHLAAAAAGPGIMVIEAPMGIGKTEAALAAAETLAARCGADGLFVGLPTQATTNQVWTRIRSWLTTQNSRATLTLAHGKAARHDDYRQLLLRGVGECDTVTASRWLSGGKKRLLAPIVVGTVDQVLLAGIASRHVALRHLGLAGKVVIIDEVHAYDAYMSVILHRVLAWLGAAAIPVILLSATLPASTRTRLLNAYAGTSTTTGDNPPSFYPRITWLDAPAAQAPNQPPSDTPQRTVAAAQAGRTTTAHLEHLDERHDDDSELVAEMRELLAGGGSALVLRNTVRRAQQTWRALTSVFGAEQVTLAHARFTTADRRDRDRRLIDQFGPQQPNRPTPHIVVATQVAEQSLDVDFDVLITDLAPIDLLLQRLGRIHRHTWRTGRPSRLATPRMIIAGQYRYGQRPPRLPWGSTAVYGEHLLWRTAAALRHVTSVNLPAGIRDLIEQVYGTHPIGPPSWQPELDRASAEQADKLAAMENAARQIILPHPTADSLTAIASIGEAHDESHPDVQATVRLGAPTLEVILLRDSHRPSHAHPVSTGPAPLIPLNAAPSPDLIDVILDQAIRLPASLTDAALTLVTTPAAWTAAPWLSDVRVLRLTTDGGPLKIGDYTVTYDSNSGLTSTRI